MSRFVSVLSQGSNFVLYARFLYFVLSTVCLSLTWTWSEAFCISKWWVFVWFMPFCDFQLRSKALAFLYISFFFCRFELIETFYRCLRAHFDTGHLNTAIFMYWHLCKCVVTVTSKMWTVNVHSYWYCSHVFCGFVYLLLLIFAVSCRFTWYFLHLLFHR